RPSTRSRLHQREHGWSQARRIRADPYVQGSCCRQEVEEVMAMQKGNDTAAVVKGVRVSAQKARLVADMVRGKPVAQALNILAFTPKKSAVIIRKAVESA